jgi:aminobenzoyl-glutamate utilization protein B
MQIENWIEQNQELLIDVSKQVWDFSELGYEETRSASVLADTLEELGFEVERGIAGIPTAFVASFGSEGPVVGILGEYDALPGLSQEAVPYPEPRQAGGTGHGCGHNLLGVGSLAASVAVKQAIQSGEVKGTIRYYGCPAEEGGSGKVFMVREGLFEDVDMALCWHPASMNVTMNMNMLAVKSFYFRFRGRSAHAAIDPHQGRSALDGVELMNVGVNYLREHVIPEARMHYVITNGGGTAPNVVPDFAEVFYYLRAPRMDQIDHIFERVKDVARGAALMSGTEVEIQLESASSNLILNDPINRVMQAKMDELGAPQFNGNEKEFAQTISATLPADAYDSLAEMMGMPAVQARAIFSENPLPEMVVPMMPSGRVMPASTDVGDVSWVTPTGQIGTVCQVVGTPGHSWQVTAQSGMGIGFRGMLYAGKVMGLTAAEFMKDPELLAEAKADFEKRTGGSGYECPIPADVGPGLPAKA